MEHLGVIILVIINVSIIALLVVGVINPEYAPLGAVLGKKAKVKDEMYYKVKRVACAVSLSIIILLMVMMVCLMLLK